MRLLLREGVAPLRGAASIADPYLGFVRHWRTAPQAISGRCSAAQSMHIGSAQLPGMGLDKVALRTPNNEQRTTTLTATAGGGCATQTTAEALPPALEPWWSYVSTPCTHPQAVACAAAGDGRATPPFSGVAEASPPPTGPTAALGAHRVRGPTGHGRASRPWHCGWEGGEATGCRIAQGPVSPARLAPPNGPQRKYLAGVAPGLCGPPRMVYHSGHA